MSLYRERKTKINDARALEEALKQKGFSPLRHSQPVPLEGYMGDKRKDTAEIIIPRQQVGRASNDIGFKRLEDGSFAAIISDFDKSHGYGDGWLKEIIGLATEAKAMRIVQKLDLEQIGRTELPNGKIRLQFTQRG